MPWSGSAPNQTFVRSTGTQTGATAWQLEDAAGTRVVAAKFDTHDQDIADGLSACLKRDGGNKPSANIPMGTFKLTGMGAGADATDSLTLGQAQSSIISHAASVGGSVDAITATFSPIFTAYTAKMRFRFTAGGANTVTAPTVNVDGLGAKTIKKLNSAALAAGDIAGSGHVCICVYDGTDVLLLNPATAPAPTESLIIAASDEITAITAGTSKTTFRMPYAFTVTAVRASLSTAQTSGNIFTVDINEAGTTIISTKLTIDNAEKTSTTAATPAVISDAALADDAEMTIDVDQIGDGTAKGLKVYLIGRRVV